MSECSIYDIIEMRAGICVNALYVPLWKLEILYG